MLKFSVLRLPECRMLPNWVKWIKNKWTLVFCLLLYAIFLSLHYFVQSVQCILCWVHASPPTRNLSVYSLLQCIFLFVIHISAFFIGIITIFKSPCSIALTSCLKQFWPFSRVGFLFHGIAFLFKIVTYLFHYLHFMEFVSSLRQYWTLFAYPSLFEFFCLSIRLMHIFWGLPGREFCLTLQEQSPIFVIMVLIYACTAVFCVL